jgi:isocitrate dehydrogenase
MSIMKAVLDAGYEIIKTENLYTFDGEPAFSAGQGQ